MRQSSGAIKVEVKSLGLALPHQRYEDCLDFQLTAILCAAAVVKVPFASLQIGC